MKRILMTAGVVYGPLDSNKLLERVLVGNRVRGLWATRFAAHLCRLGHEVTLLVPDIMDQSLITKLVVEHHKKLFIVMHRGFWDYLEKCINMATTHDAAILAAAVVNWIPAEPYEGKMPTTGFDEGDIIQVPFILAPHVINQMKVANPKLTLIGCKMLVNASEDDLIEAAYGVLLKAKCNAVVANDMGKGLKRKLVVNQDRTVQEYNDDFDGFYANLLGHIEDEHFQTTFGRRDGMMHLADCWDGNNTFNLLVRRNRDRFMPFAGGRVFGAVAIQVGISGRRTGWLVSPREKGEQFTSKDATLVTEFDAKRRTVTVPVGMNKPSLNAVLLARFGLQFGHRAVLHFHEQVPGLPTLLYAPPGTVRDNLRELPVECLNGFNIEGHGCVIPAEYP